MTDLAPMQWLPRSIVRSIAIGRGHACVLGVATPKRQEAQAP